MDEGLITSTKEVAMGLFKDVNKLCHSEDLTLHMRLDTACLHVTNTDHNETLQFWAQSKECYKCPPWKYLDIPAQSSRILLVNTTYPTDVYIKNNDGSNKHYYRYLFDQFGTYSSNFDDNNISKMQINRPPDKEILPIVMLLVFFLMLTLFWQFGKFLLKRMDESSQNNTTETSEQDPILDYQSSYGTSSSPTPGPSQANWRQVDSPPLYGAAYASPRSVQGSPSSAAAVSPSSIMSSPRAPVPDSRSTSGRLRSLDTFRGIAIVVMIFVNYGGGKYYFFKHSRWNGLTVADLVFPWFMWIMGVSLTFSIRSQLRRATKHYVMVGKIVKRCLILFALGLIINSKGHNDFPTFRIVGVLQRFAIVYLVNAVMEVFLMHPQESSEYVWYWPVRDLVRSWGQLSITLGLVLLHTLLTFLLPVPGCPKGYLGPGGLHEEGNYFNCTGGAAGYIDKLLLGRQHVYPHPTCKSIYDSTEPYDPEGLLGALTSCAIVQMGVACGRIILTFQSHGARVRRWIIWGSVTGILGAFLCGFEKEGGWIPVNKNLWSLSFILVMSSFAFILLTILYKVIDEWNWWSGNPFRYAGMNSILLYVGHEICSGLFPWSWSPVGDYHLYHLIMNAWGTSLWVITAYLCHRNKFYLSI